MKGQENATPASPGVTTGGTLAGQEVSGGSVLKGGPEGNITDTPHSWDSAGERVEVAPELAGTVAGNTTAAGALVGQQDEEAPAPARRDWDPS